MPLPPDGGSGGLDEHVGAEPTPVPAVRTAALFDGANAGQIPGCEAFLAEIGDLLRRYEVRPVAGVYSSSGSGQARTSSVQLSDKGAAWKSSAPLLSVQTTVPRVSENEASAEIPPQISKSAPSWKPSSMGTQENDESNLVGHAPMHLSRPLHKLQGQPGEEKSQGTTSTSMLQNARKMAQRSMGKFRPSYTTEDLARKAQATSKVSVLADDEWRSEARPVRRALRRVFASSVFETVLACTILANSIVIGWEVEDEAQNIGNPSRTTFFVVNCIFTSIFTVELMLRLYAEGSAFCGSANIAWNAIDSAMVLCALFETTVEALVAMGMLDTQGLKNLSNLRIVRMLRITRCVRTLRMTRLIRFVAALRTLVASIYGTLKSLVWALLLLMMLIYMAAIVFTESATSSISLNGHDADLEEWWGNLPRAMLTLFMSISGGVSWFDPARPLEEISVWLLALFTIYIFFTYFAVLNVVTGVFCQSAIETVAHDPDLAAQSMLGTKKSYAGKLSRLFKSVDRDGSGLITLDELEGLLADERMNAYISALGLEAEDAWTVFKLIDIDGSNAIDIDEFVSGVMRLRGQAKGIDMQSVLWDQKWLMKRLTKFMSHVEDQFSLVTGSRGLTGSRALTGSRQPTTSRLNGRLA